MNKKERKELEGWMMDVLLKTKKKLLLDKYDNPIIETITHGYLQIVCNYPYLDYVIRYGPDVEQDYTIRRDYLEKALVHEMCHLVLEPLKHLIDRPRKVQREEVTATLEHTVDHLRRIVENND